MSQPSVQATPQPIAPPPTPTEQPGGGSRTLWNQLTPIHQRQLSQHLAELIRRIRQAVTTREGPHDYHGTER